MQQKISKLLPWLGLLVALLFFSKSGYLYLKAELSQVLIAKAWNQLLLDGNVSKAKPWSWADTYPVAKITSQRDNRVLYVLEGTSGEALAFGPGHYEGTALPAEEGESVIAGHRDSHFSFLQNSEIGDMFSVQNYKNKKAIYQIEEIKIVDSSKEKLKTREDENRLQLITCYPFNAVKAGGDMRYVLYAKRLERKTF